jgi:hypothetical protein
MDCCSDQQSTRQNKFSIIAFVTLICFDASHKPGDGVVEDYCSNVHMENKGRFVYE